MFLCTKCHGCGCVHFGGSYGPCEGCKKTAECIDCHCSCPITKPKKKKKGK